MQSLSAASNRALSLSVADLDGVLHWMPVPMIRTDLSGTVRFVNPSAEALLKIAGAELLGCRYDAPPMEVSTVQGDAIDFSQSPIARALRGERVKGYEAAVQLAGEPQPHILCFDAAPCHDGNGQIAGALLTLRDMTPQHRSQEALRSSQRRLDSVLNNTRMAVFLMDERQHCSYANAAAEALTGYSLGEMQGRPLHDVVHHKRPDGTHYPLHECPIDRAFPEDFQVEGEEVFVHRDGSFYPVAFTASPIRDDASRTIGTVIEVRSIAEEKRREAERQDVEQRFRNMADHSPMMMWVTAPDGACTYLNRGWYEFTGQEPEEAMGFGWLDAVHEDDRGWSGEAFHKANAAQEAFRVEYRLRRFDGAYRWAIDAAAPRFSADGAFLGYIGSVIDIDERHEAEALLRDTEERYRLALSATNDTIWDWDLRSNVVRWNEALETTHGWKLSEMDAGGEWWLDHVHPDDRERIAESIHSVIDSDSGVSTWFSEYRFLRADGSYANVLDRGAVLRDSEGRALRMIGAMLDQTEQQRQQAALRENEQMLRSLTEGMPNIAWISAGDGAVEWFNARWYQFTGTALGSGLDDSWGGWVHPDDRDAAMQRWQAAVSKGVPFENEHRFRDANGRYRWFLARGTPLVGRQGETKRWFGTCTDIQDLVEARNYLKRSREELAREAESRARELDRIWSITDDLFVVCDFEQVCRNVNPAWHQALGFPPSQLLGRRLESLVAPVDVHRFREALATLHSQGFVKDVDLRVLASDGSAHFYAWNLRVEGDIFYASGRDVTRRMQLENQLRQAQKMETVGKLTGGVAHDFNNLLQVISGNLQLLARHVAGNEPAEKRVHNALAGVGRGAKLASQLLAFGRRQPLEPKVLHVGKLVRDMDDMLRRTLGEAVEIEVVVSGGLWNSLVDPVQLENAVLNLAINARDAMEGAGKLTIEAGNASLDDVYCRSNPEATAGQFVVIAVSDTGCGMTPDVMAQVFEPFFSTKPEGKGTGLGLSMVYGFVKQSNGSVKIYSEPGQGTTIKLYLPRSKETVDELVSHEASLVRGGTETILVAEDDAEVRATTLELLKSLGYRVLTAKDAASALTIIESGVSIDLLFTDVVMPGPLRSPELARKAQERLPGLAVLFTSGYTENAIVHAGRLDPGLELLSKPYSQEMLSRKLRHVLANQQQRNQSLGRPDRSAATSATARALGRRSLLLVEDDAVIRVNTAELLELEGFEVVQAKDAAQALEILRQRGPEILIADLGLPDQQGDALAAQARELYPELAVVFATGRDEHTIALPGAVLLRKPYDASALFAALADSIEAAIKGDTPR